MMELTRNRLYGEYLGYPPCCIKAFGDVAIMWSDRPELTKKMTQNGFLPCPECAMKLAQGVVTYNQLINPNRKCSVPFVLDPTPEQDKKLVLELRALKG